MAQDFFFTFLKRLIDFSFAIIVTIFFWWLLALIWICIKLDSTGPGIFSQTRVGKGKKKFTCYKFRTMKVGALQVGTHDMDTSSITNLGFFLRQSKLDELPQIWNIFRGELSLVGPRPCLLVQTKLIEERSRRKVFNVLPGITGLAQVNGVDMKNPVKLAKLDQKYVNTQSISNDLKIILRTFIIQKHNNNKT